VNVKHLIAATHRLAGVLERENMALAVMDLPGAAALLPEKTIAIAELAAFAEGGAAPRQADLI
jgi:hypothetical protein